MKQINAAQETIAVIGAGIVGVTTALKLQREGYKVTLIDEKGIAEGCSKGNAGHFATEQVFPLAQKGLLPHIPAMLINPLGPFKIDIGYLPKAIPWFVRFLINMKKNRFDRNKHALKSLTELALQSWKTQLSDANLTNKITLNGSLLTFSGSKLTAEKVLKEYVSEGVSAELLNREQLDILEPGIDKTINYAILFPEVGHSIDPYNLVHDLFKVYQACGGEYIETSIINISQFDNHVTITSKTANYEYEKIVICAGAYSKSLCAYVGLNVPLEAERGYHLMVKSTSMPKRPIASFDKKFILTPMTSGLRLAGTVEFAGVKKNMNIERAKVLLPLGKSIWPDIYEQSDSNHWMGCRPSLPDSLPVISQSLSTPRVYYNFGHQHLGLTLAAISAELITSIIKKESNKIDVTPFRIDRF